MVNAVERQAKGNPVPPYEIDRGKFFNPVGNQAENWQQGMANFLGATTGSAPQAGMTQLGAAQLYGGANIGNTQLSGGANVGPTATFGGAQLNAGQYNQTFQQEGALANQLALQAAGQGPSLAQATAKQQAEQNIANQMAVLGSQRGGNPALAQYQAQQQAAVANQAAAQQAVQGRIQEQQAAQANYGNLLGAMNQQAQGFAGTSAQLQQQAQLASMGAINQQNLAQAQLGQQNQQFNAGAMNAQQLAQAQLMQQAGLANQGASNQFTMEQAQLNQQTQMANLQAMLAQGQINAQQYNQYMQMLQAQNLAQYAGGMGMEELAVRQQLGIGQINAGSDSGGGASQAAIGGTIAAIGAAAAAFSDKRVKTNIKSGRKQLESMLNKIHQDKGILGLLAVL